MTFQEFRSMKLSENQLRSITGGTGKGTTWTEQPSGKTGTDTANSGPAGTTFSDQSPAGADPNTK